MIGACFGGVGLKVLDQWLSKSKVKDDSATKFRDELRQEVLALREELRQARAELIATDKRSDGWQQKYFDLMVSKNRPDT